MRILCVHSIISKHGGAELAAINLAQGLADRGHEVHFLGAQGQTTLSDRSLQTNSAAEQISSNNIHLHQRTFPRPFALGQQGNYLRKAIWHIRDLMYPANERSFDLFAREIAADVIILHGITAIGLNIWRPIRKSRTPCIQVIHDLGLICFNTAQFKSGRQCSGLCVPCRFQKWFRFSLIHGASNFAFVSPSRAMLNKIETYAPLSAWRTEVIPNPNTFTVNPRIWHESDRPHFLYVGRLDPPKGVDMMLRAAEAAQTIAPFDLDILGSGTLQQSLKHTYANSNWVHFHGSVDQNVVADFMSRATALLVPSLWLENAPTVIVNALFAGLPIIASNIGGIPEHVEDGITGSLLPPGDEKAWTVEIARIVANRAQISAWSAACLLAARRFDPRKALDDYESLIQTMIAHN